MRVLTDPAVTKISGFDLERIRKDFPVLSETAYGKPLVYLDNAATTQKPRSVIEALNEYYSGYNANIHRGVHFLSQKAGEAYDRVRVLVKDFIHAASEREIIFTRGTTESINLVAATFGRKYISAGDEIIISGMEHHSNIVPWQLLCEEKGAVLKVIPVLDNGELDLASFQKLIGDKTCLVSVVHTSNTLGTVNPVKEIIRIAHSRKIKVLVDAAQAMIHSTIDVQDLDCDFLAFSGHKMLGPTGTGVLYGKAGILEKLPPYQGGGEMIESVSFDKTTFADIPVRFEAGTPSIADVIGMGSAIGYLNTIDRKAAGRHEKFLLKEATAALEEIPGVRIIGNSPGKASVVSFVVDGLNALDIGMYLDTRGIAVRTGHHCTEPLMNRFGIPGTVRASFLFYNTGEEVRQLTESLKMAIQLLTKK